MTFHLPIAIIVLPIGSCLSIVIIMDTLSAPLNLKQMRVYENLFGLTASFEAGFQKQSLRGVL